MATPKKRRLESITVRALSYFEEISVDEKVKGSASKKTHICKLCTERLCGKFENNLASHLSARHADIFNEISHRIEHITVERLKFLQNLVEIVSVNGRSFSTLMDSGFQKIIEPQLRKFRDARIGINLSNEYLQPVKDKLEKTANKIREIIKYEVKDRSLSLMLDIVTKHGRSILGASPQYSVKGQLKIRSIAMIELIESHTGIYLAEVIIKRLKEYGINLAQIFTITTDNGKNVLKMVRDIVDILQNEVQKSQQCRIEQSQEVDEETDAAIEQLLAQMPLISDDEALDRIFGEAEGSLNPSDDNETLLTVITNELTKQGVDFLWNITGINCAEHTLQLAINDSLKEVKKTVKNVITLAREICKQMRLPSTSLEMQKMNIEYKLPRLEVKTRWGSMFLMVSLLIYEFLFKYFFAMNGAQLLQWKLFFSVI